MKKLLLVTILSTIFLSANGQEKQVSPIDQEKSPLLVIQYITEKIEFHDHNSSELLKAIPTKGISSIEVLKGNSAKALYGDGGKNGVIMLTLSKSNSNDLFFKKLQAGKLPSPQIKIDANISVGEKSSFTLDPSRSVESGQTIIKGNSQLNQNNASPLILVRLGNKEMKINNLTELEDIDAKLIKSIDVYKKEPSLGKYGSKGKNGIIEVTLQKNKSAKDYFEKLKVGYKHFAGDALEKNKVEHFLDDSKVVIENGKIRFTGSGGLIPTSVKPKIVLEHNGDRLLIVKPLGLSDVDLKLVKSFDIIKSTDGDPKQDYHLIRLELENSSKANSHFRKLKRSLKE